MDKKQLFFGAIIGFIANSIGFVLSSLLLHSISNHSITWIESISKASDEGFLGKIISLGAILNLLCFFYFIKQHRDSRAGGVLLATILVAFGTIVIKL
jgi:hypothetical protein